MRSHRAGAHRATVRPLTAPNVGAWGFAVGRHICAPCSQARALRRGRGAHVETQPWEGAGESAAHGLTGPQCEPMPVMPGTSRPVADAEQNVLQLPGPYFQSSCRA